MQSIAVREIFIGCHFSAVLPLALNRIDHDNRTGLHHIRVSVFLRKHRVISDSLAVDGTGILPVARKAADDITERTAVCAVDNSAAAESLQRKASFILSRRSKVHVFQSVSPIIRLKIKSFAAFVVMAEELHLTVSGIESAGIGIHKPRPMPGTVLFTPVRRIDQNTLAAGPQNKTVFLHADRRRIHPFKRQIFRDIPYFGRKDKPRIR